MPGALVRWIPDAQLVEDGIVFVNPAIAVLIVLAQFAVAIALRRAKQLAAIVDVPIAIAVQRQETAAAGEHGQGFGSAVGIEIEIKATAVQLGCRAVEIDHQRIRGLDGIAHAYRGAGCFAIAALHGKLHAEADFLSVGGADNALGGELR